MPATQADSAQMSMSYSGEILLASFAKTAPGRLTIEDTAIFSQR
jgi:hypothetical protein